MKKLVSSSDAAKLLGLSLQGIHYRIKKGQMESMKKDGKTYVYIDESEIKEQPAQNPVYALQALSISAHCYTEIYSGLLRLYLSARVQNSHHQRQDFPDCNR